MRRLISGFVVLTLIPIVAMAADQYPSAAAPSLPSGFSRIPTATGFGEYELVNFEFLPGGDILAAGKCGALRRVTLAGASIALTPIPVYCSGDRGLLGIDLAPDFESSRRIYTLYTYRRADNRAWARLSYWTANDAVAPTALANEVVVLDDLPSFSSTGATCDDSHTIGTVVAAPDGTVYVGNGDASSYCAVDASALESYNLSSPRGKIFHINPDGSAVATNPYYDSANPSSWRSRVFAMGARNPFRFDLKPGTDTLYVGDVGWNNYEEISIARSTGANLGWPCWEGPLDFRNAYAGRPECSTAFSTMTAVEPTYAWNHAGANAAAVGGTFYTGDTYPADYRGAFFFADYALSRIWTMRTDADDNVVRAPESTGFATEIGAPAAFRSGPGGDIFYADLLSGNIYRLRYAPGNREPVARIVVDRTAGPAPLAIQFDGRESYDLDGEVLTYSWDFGDGGSSNSANPTHTYGATGNFTARLTVTDQLGLWHTATLVITPGNSPPVLSVQAPPLGTTFAVGETLDLAATATDAEDGSLPPSSITFSTVQRHCAYGGTCHAHPGPVVGEQQSPGRCVVVIGDHGDDSYLEVVVTARDVQGATTTQVVRVDPTYRHLTVASTIGTVPISVNSSNTISYPTFRLVAGSQNSVVAPTVYQDKEFVRWADGAPRERLVVMPNSDLVLTAVYTWRPTATASATPAAGPAPLTVAFSSAGSSDPDGGPVTYAWDFGDGSPGSTVANPAHTYTSLGAFNVTLTVTDVDGVSSNATTRVSVDARPLGLVAGFAFDEATGDFVWDSSGLNNNGTASSGVSRSVSGHSGGALSFNGTSGAVTIPDSNSLDLGTGFTLSAWVRPTVVAGWRTVVLKEQGSSLSYALYAGDWVGHAAGWAVLSGVEVGATATSIMPSNAWTYVATTYDGSTLRTYVNGVLEATTAGGGSFPASTGPLMIGGNSIWGEWFSGLIDDVRIYDRALSLSELSTDMATAVPTTPPPIDTTAPSQPNGFSATATGNAVALVWQGATDNVGVTGYDVHRGTIADYIPTAANRIATVATVAYTDGNLSPDTYYYTVIARDAAGNGSPPAAIVQTTVAGDVSAPSQPTGLVATGGIERVGLAWSPSSDDVGVTGYDVHRSTAAGFTPSSSNRIATVATTSFTDAPLSPGTYRYRVVARDQAGRSSVASDEAIATSSADAPPSVTLTAPGEGATVTGTVALTAAANDDVGLIGVQFKVDGVNVGAENATEPYSVAWSSVSVANGAHVITAVARDSKGATSTSAPVTVSVNNVAAPSGLVAAYGFNEGSGTTVNDSSGLGNGGTVSGATRSSTGRFGGALSFDGVNDSVSIADAPSLDLAGPLTISAWVRPTTLSGWRTVILKEGGTSGLVYALYSSTNNNRPGGYLEIGGAEREVKGTASVAKTEWRHLSLTYDGATLKIYINGVLRGSRSQTGLVAASSGPLKIGGNAVWSEWYAGLIDEVRIYNRALSASEISAMMNQPI